MDDVVFQDGAASQDAFEDRHRNDCGRNGSGDRQANFQSKIGVDHAEGDGEYSAEYDGLHSELGNSLLGTNVRNELLRRLWLCSCLSIVLGSLLNHVSS